jgi:hypothetical protein
MTEEGFEAYRKSFCFRRNIGQFLQLIAMFLLALCTLPLLIDIFQRYFNAS